MPTTKAYTDAVVTVLRSTERPGQLVAAAMSMTMKQDVDRSSVATRQQLAYLTKANHTSLLEHASITFYLMGVSRSFLAQITRHRMSSFTSASQHYQDYRDYDNIVHPDHVSLMDNSLYIIDEMYKNLVDTGMKPEEARQILPNAKAVNIMWTVNARSLINFLNLRTCHRNVEEMRHVANKIHMLAMDWWPELFVDAGPDCEWNARGCKCYQGKMYCGRKGVTLA